MARTSMNDIIASINAGFAQVNTRMDAMDARIAALETPSAKQNVGSKKGNGKAQPKVAKVAFTKHDGTTVMVTPKQAEAWTKYREGYGTRVEAQARKEANLAKFEADRNAFKPSKKLLDFIKANPICTRKEAMQHGFVGTKDDLKALKASIRK